MNAGRLVLTADSGVGPKRAPIQLLLKGRLEFSELP